MIKICTIAHFVCLIMTNMMGEKFFNFGQQIDNLWGDKGWKIVKFGHFRISTYLTCESYTIKICNIAHLIDLIETNLIKKKFFNFDQFFEKLCNFIFPKFWKILQKNKKNFFSCQTDFYTIWNIFGKKKFFTLEKNYLEKFFTILYVLLFWNRLSNINNQLTIHLTKNFYRTNSIGNQKFYFLKKNLFDLNKIWLSYDHPNSKTRLWETI